MCNQGQIHARWFTLKHCVSQQGKRALGKNRILRRNCTETPSETLYATSAFTPNLLSASTLPWKRARDASDVNAAWPGPICFRDHVTRRRGRAGTVLLRRMGPGQIVIHLPELLSLRQQRENIRAWWGCEQWVRHACACAVRSHQSQNAGYVMRGVSG